MLVQEKSRGMAVALAFFFGPLGLLYVSPTSAVLMFLVLVVLGFMTAGIALPIVWILCMGLGDHLVIHHNKAAAKTRELFAERAKV